MQRYVISGLLLRLAVALLALGCVATMIWPKWIEALFGADPDGGSGSLEWLVLRVGSTALLASIAAVAAVRSRRARRASSFGRAVIDHG